MCTANDDGAKCPSRRGNHGTLRMTCPHSGAPQGAYAGARSAAVVGMEA